MFPGLLLLLFWIFVLPTTAAAQACLGVPGRPALSLETGLDRAEEHSVYSATLASALPGPGWLRGSYGLVTSDTLFHPGHRFSVQFGGEAVLRGFSICPSVGIQHSRYEEVEMVLDSLAVVLDMYDSKTTRFDLPVGLAVGYSVHLPGGIVVTPAAFLGRRWSRWRVRALDLTEVERQDWLRGSTISVAWRDVYLSFARWPERIDHSEPENLFTLGIRPRW